jgi:hypothetical protein
MRIITESFQIKTAKGNVENIETKHVRLAVNAAHEILDKFTDFDVDVFQILGMRNLSSFIGEIFAASMVKAFDGYLVKNPHQDGYPDLLIMNEEGKKLWESLSKNLRDKTPFSPFGNGGIEVKATCGSVPTPKICERKGIIKPDIGDTRIDVLTGYDWKAHHRETNNLMGIMWDFINKVPRIVSVFFSSELSELDWGKIVQPKDGGGRTTSVSIMTRNGVRKMYEGTLLINDTNAQYSIFLDRYNNGSLLKN